jgi:hypothetical protein
MGLIYVKRELSVKKKKSQDMGVLLNLPVRTGTKSFQSGIRVTKDRTL